VAPLPTLHEAEAALMAIALRHADGNQGVAAGLLGVSRQALNKHLRRRHPPPGVATRVSHCLETEYPRCGSPGASAVALVRRRAGPLCRARSQGSNPWQTQVMALGVSRSSRIFLWI
jgi:hypothetical protein